MESLSLPFDYSTPSPPGTPISEPNRSLLGLSTASNMPKNKNKGVQGDTPTKSPRKEGRRSVQINYSHYSKKGAETGLLGMARIPYLAPRCSSRTVVIVMGIFSNNTYYHTYLTTVIPICHTATSEEDDLDMSVIQEGNGSVHSSELDSTIQSDPIPPEGAQGPTPGPALPPAGKTYGPRQSTPNPDTPKSTHPEEDTEKDSDESSSSESDAGNEEEDKLDADALAQRDLQNDLSEVREAVSMAGGLASNKPDFKKQKDREGQHVEIVEEWVDFTEETFNELPERPAESTLRRISLKELLPPAPSTPVPLDMELDGEELSFVANQRIEFLVIMRKDGDAKTNVQSRTGRSQSRYDNGRVPLVPGGSEDWECQHNAVHHSSSAVQMYPA